MFAAEWLKTYPAAAGTSHTTSAARKIHVEHHLLLYCKDTPLNRIDRKSIDKFAARMFSKVKGKPAAERVRKTGTGEKPLAPWTVLAVLLTLRRILKTAIEYGDLAILPTVPRIKVPERPFKFYDAAEAERLIQAAGGDTERAILTFAIHTGARAGELLAVRRGDIDLRLAAVTLSS